MIMIMITMVKKLIVVLKMTLIPSKYLYQCASLGIWLFPSHFKIFSKKEEKKKKKQYRLIKKAIKTCISDFFFYEK